MNILLIDDHELFRSGIKLLLADFAEPISFHEASSFEAALAQPGADPMDVVLLDFHIPGQCGLDAIAAIRAHHDRALLVVLSAEDDPQLIRSCIDAGAAGFIPKASSHAVMLAALRLVLAGGTFLPRHALLGQNSPRAPAAPDAQQTTLNLTPRQIDALRLAVQGKSNKLIARDLDISEATVKAHLSTAFRVLGVHNRTEAVLTAAERGLPL